MIHGRCVESMSTLSVLLQGDGLARGEMSKELARVDAMGGVVRTSIDTARLIVVHAEIAGSRLALRLRDLAPGLGEIFSLHLERVHVDIPVGAVAGAQSTSYAPVLNHHLQAALTADRPYRTPDH